MIETRVDERGAWHDDVALELWVDMARLPVLIRLTGTLDEATGPSLLSVVGDLLHQGVRRIELRTDGLNAVEPGGPAALRAAERMADRFGGRLQCRSAEPTPGIEAHGRPG